VSIGKII
jgi:hypothetical protein